MQAFAQFEEGKEQVTVSKITGSVLNNTSPYPSAIQTYSAGGFEDAARKKIRNVVWFKLNENATTVMASGFTATVTFSIESKATLASSPVTTTKALTINYNNTSGAKYIPTAYIVLPFAEEIKITVQNLSVSGNVGWSPTPLLELSNEMSVIRYYTLSNNSSLLQPAFLTPVNNTDHLTVSWTWPSGTNNNMTQIEWAWVRMKCLVIIQVLHNFLINLLQE